MAYRDETKSIGSMAACPDPFHELLVMWCQAAARAAVLHLEFLIDRFGYARARWRIDEGLLPAIPAIIGKIDEINVEPQIRLSPEEHFH